MSAQFQGSSRKGARLRRACPAFTRAVSVGNFTRIPAGGEGRPGDGRILQTAHQELHHLLELPVPVAETLPRSMIRQNGRNFIFIPWATQPAAFRGSPLSLIGCRKRKFARIQKTAFHQACNPQMDCSHSGMQSTKTSSVSVHVRTTLPSRRSANCRTSRRNLAGFGKLRSLKPH
jgi:hypothetical protein